MGRNHIGLHPKTEQEAHQGGREIPSTRTADQAGIIIKGEHARQAMLAEKLSHDLEERLGIELATRLAMQPDGGASIDEVGNLDDMRPLSFRIGGYATGIFEIELDFLARLPELQRPAPAATILPDAARLAQDLPDRRRLSAAGAPRQL